MTQQTRIMTHHYLTKNHFTAELWVSNIYPLSKNLSKIFSRPDVSDTSPVYFFHSDRPWQWTTRPSSRSTPCCAIRLKPVCIIDDDLIDVVTHCQLDSSHETYEFFIFHHGVFILTAMTPNNGTVVLNTMSVDRAQTGVCYWWWFCWFLWCVVSWIHLTKHMNSLFFITVSTRPSWWVRMDPIKSFSLNGHPQCYSCNQTEHGRHLVRQVTRDAWAMDLALPWPIVVVDPTRHSWVVRHPESKDPTDWLYQSASSF